MRFALLDTTGAIPSTSLIAYACAQQRQLREHYAACFDGDGAADEVRVIADKSQLVAGEMLCLLEDQPPADVQGALGYHDLGVLHVYKGLCEQNGTSWTSCMSHEMLEARHDTRLHGCVELDDGTIWDTEICDRVEATSYTIDGVELSNFNTPECFEPPPFVADTPGATPLRHFARAIEPGVTGGMYDWLGKSQQPNQVLDGGYAQQYTLDKGWQMKGTMRPYRAKLAELRLSRGAKRGARAA